MCNASNRAHRQGLVSKGSCAVQIMQSAALQPAGGITIHTSMGEKCRGTEMDGCSSRWTQEGIGSVNDTTPRLAMNETQLSRLAIISDSDELEEPSS